MWKLRFKSMRHKKYRGLSLNILGAVVKGFPRLRLAASLLVISVVFAAGCGEKDATPPPDRSDFEIHRSAVHPQCSYGIYRDPRGRDDLTVLYYFHGSGGDVRTWLGQGRPVIDAWDPSTTRFPLVIAVSCGPEWVAYPEGISPEKPSLDAFVRDLIPEMEKIAGVKPHHRIAFGFSKGGTNAAQLFFRYPELFHEAVLVSPLVYPISPEASPRQIEELARSSGLPAGGPLERAKDFVQGRSWIERNIANNLAREKSYLISPIDWPRADILSNIRRDPKGSPRRLYVSSGRLDEIVLFPGASKLAEEAGAKGYEVDFQAINGGHMSLDAARIAAFLKRGAP
jgi:predicted esterase